MRILIIGAVAAGTSAATKASRNNKDAEIVIYEKGPHISYAGCDIPFFISSKIKNIEALMPRSVDYFKEKYNVEVKIKHEVIKIDRQKKTLTVKNLDNDETFTDNYDKLIIATGARSIIPPISGVEQGHVFSLRNIKDALAIDAFIRDKRPQNAAIIGSGSIGMELSESLIQRGLKVHLVEMLPHVNPAMDHDMSAHIEEYLKSKNIKIYTNTRATGIAANHDLTGEDEKIPADIVIIAAGVRPEVSLAKEAGIKLGDTGAIAVNQYLQTSDPDVYACGDCIETFNLVTEKPAYIPLGSTANKTGRIAGDVVTGGNLSFRGVLGTGIFKVFDLSVARTGLTEQQALAAGYQIETVHIKGPDKASQSRGKDLIIKAIADKKTRKLLGVQIVGYEGVDKRIDVLATAMTFGAKVDDLFHLDLAYSPVHSTAKDLVHYVGMVLESTIDKD